MPETDKINFFGQTTYRNQMKKFGIKPDDRRRHVYIIGKTGMGKTELLKTMIVQDIREGHGVGFVDPHGEAAEELLDFIPKERIKDIVYFNPADLNFPISFNVMEKVSVEHRHLVASGLMEVFKKIWPDVWSARMEYILHNSILALLEYPGSTLLGINRMLADPDYRSEVVGKITDPVVKSFWLQEFARYTQRYEVEATAAIQNKIGQFISSPLIRNIIGQVTSSVNMRKVMDEGKILVLNLSKGRIGEESSKLLGGLLITKLQLGAMSRVDVPEQERRDFFLFVDEFQNFATESFVNILSEARKYRLNLILAHQYIAQMEEPVRDAVFGNVGTLVSFRVGAEDAEFLEKEFSPEFFANDIVDLPKRQIYLKLMVDGVAGRPFSAYTLDAFEKPAKTYGKEIIEYSRKEYASERKDVEEEIARWTGTFVLKEPPKEGPVLYDAQCQRCRKWTKVPFKPEPGKSLYCKPCLKKVEKEREERREKELPDEREKTKKTEKAEKAEAEKAEEGATLSLEDLLLKKPIAFSKTKRRQDSEKKQKKINKEELKKALRDSLAGLKTEGERKKSPVPPPDSADKPQEASSSTTKQGKLKPGETVKF